jgi:predicted membrane protein
VLISPVLYWNIKNNFSSFQYQTDHVLSVKTDILKNMLSSFGIQLFSWGVGPFIVAFAGLTQLRKSLKIAFVFLIVFLVFFVYVAINEVLLPHWMLVFFIMLIPLAYGGFFESQKFKRSLSLSFLFSAILTLALLFEMGFKVFPAQWTAGLYEGVSGWDEVMKGANEQLAHLTSDKKALAVMNWTLGSRALYYNQKKSEVFIIDTRHDQFDIWQPLSPIGYDLLVVVEAAKKDEHLAHLNCVQLTSVGEKIFRLKNITVNHFLYYHCAHYLGYKD